VSGHLAVHAVTAGAWRTYALAVAAAAGARGNHPLRGGWICRTARSAAVPVARVVAA